ncbi:hypothetical protein SAMN05421820_102786 [Pedobacter steynii]|uniref:Uncharacterized protein n=1 Tax=Pedobacter steynii TaxID=430522 RepID=A0A1G9PW56_9SPHI|nr:hypothetical protein [Pedobacter steynii]NQX38854.1 hypothetical protein [Pedobacter steynii]SDM02994.1 hypothetical protein SAMN05421820_102786 [Pedobacter steynii]
MNFIFYKQAKTTAVLCQLLNKLGVSVSRFAIKNILETHPDYPALLSLTRSPTPWNVPNQALRLDKYDFKKACTGRGCQL